MISIFTFVTSVLCVATMAWAADSFVENLEHVQNVQNTKHTTSKCAQSRDEGNTHSRKRQIFFLCSLLSISMSLFNFVDFYAASWHLIAIQRISGFFSISEEGQMKWTICHQESISFARVLLSGNTFGISFSISFGISFGRVLLSGLERSSKVARLPTRLVRTVRIKPSW